MAEATQSLRFVTYLAPEMHDVYEEMVAYVGREAGMPASLFVGGHTYDAFERGEADFGFV